MVAPRRSHPGPPPHFPTQPRTALLHSSSKHYAPLPASTPPQTICVNVANEIGTSWASSATNLPFHDNRARLVASVRRRERVLVEFKQRGGAACRRPDQRCRLGKDLLYEEA